MTTKYSPKKQIFDDDDWQSALTVNNSSAVRKVALLSFSHTVYFNSARYRKQVVIEQILF